MTDTLMVIKRNKNEVLFQRDKIYNAVKKAFKNVRPDEEDLDRILTNITNYISRQINDKINVEDIQDKVEFCLLKRGYVDVAKHYMEYRQKQENKRKRKELKLSKGALKDYITISKYSNYRDDLKRRETNEEMVDRVLNMHIKKNPNIEQELKWAFDLCKQDKVLPSMRSLQFGGDPILKKHPRIMNCVAGPIDKPQRFKEFMYLLLCGCGVGYSIDYEHVEKLPKLANNIHDDAVKHYTIPDSIEGWANAIDELIQSYIHGYVIEFNYSKIRPKGASIKTGGKAPGHVPLRKAIEKIRNILDNSLDRKLEPIEVFDINCHIADAVLSGGVRRAATLALFSFDDHEMKLAKTGNWFDENPQRARANISARIIRNEASYRQFKRLGKAIHQYGEPGFFFSDSIYQGCNPCQPKDAIVLTKDGIRTFNDIEIGDEIWSETGWTKIINKWSTGIKPTYKYHTNCGIFYGTNNHRIVQNGEKIEVKDANAIDPLDIPEEFNNPFNYSNKMTPNIINNVEYIGDQEVFDITVDNKPHTYWSGGLNVSNCCEISMWNQITYEDGTTDTGWQCCNLTTTNGDKAVTEDEFYNMVKAASIIGTAQASFDDWKFFDKATNDIIKREALIGVSMTGILSHPDITLNEKIVKKAANIVKETNKNIAEKININPAARTTCVKPEGTSTLKLDIMLAGIHPAHDRKVLKRVQANKQDPVYQYFKKHNPHMCEESVWSVNKTDDVITFPIEASPDAMIRDDIKGLKQLDIVLKWQKWWVEEGRQHTKYANIHNNVSNTITYDEEDWDVMIEMIWNNKEHFTGISFLKYENDKKYPQAPNEAVLTDADLEKFYYLIEHYKPVDYSKMYESEDNTTIMETVACAGGACSI